MIRGFAAGVAVGTIRIWIGILLASGLLDFPDSFAAAFGSLSACTCSRANGGSVRLPPRVDSHAFYEPPGAGRHRSWCPPGPIEKSGTTGCI